VNINARDTVSFDGVGSNERGSSVFSMVTPGAEGNSGGINITTGSLSLTNGAFLAASTFGKGNAGSVTINARDRVSFDGVGSNRFPSSAFSNVNRGAEGNSKGINITTGSLSLTNGATLNASTAGKGNAGSININVRDTVSFAESTAFSQVEGEAEGNSGGINITTGSLSLTNGAFLAASTFGKGNAGSVTINARDRVSFDGVGSNGFGSSIFSIVNPEAEGNSGGITITTESLSVTNGAALNASTKGKGNAGSVNIYAHDKVSFAGAGSAIFSQVEEKEAEGNSGGINITAGSLSLTNSAFLAASSFGQGDAGITNINTRDTVSLDGANVFSIVNPKAEGNSGGINITTGSLSLTNGATLNTSTFGQGSAGSVNIYVRDRVSFDGVDSHGLSSGVFSTVEEKAVGNSGGITITTGSLSVTNSADLVTSTKGQGDAGSVNIYAHDTVSFAGGAVFSQVENGAVGNSGDINITAKSLSVTNSAFLAASSAGFGTAGNIEVSASSIRLDNKAALSSDTIAGQGNIFLRSEDLVLRRGSNITTNATGTAIGGNITIDTGVLAALENSDISANAEEAFGGRVIISAQGIFGTRFREAETSESDITATSALGPEFSGAVEINTPDIDPSRGLVSLPAVPVDTEVAQACTPGGSQTQSEFVVTGRGGLPPTPTEALSSDAIQVDWVTLNPGSENSSSPSVSTNPTSPTPARIVEAQGWIIEPSGEVLLTASAVPELPHSSWQTPANCNGS
jgi:large exoprotein involved in heme utilization and adhesion